MKSALVFCISPKVSGGELYTVQLVHALKNSGWKVAIVGSHNSPLESTCAGYDIRFIPTKIGPKLGKRSVISVLLRWKRNRRRLLSLIEAESPSLVLFQYKLEQMLWAGTPTGRTVVILEHGPVPSVIAQVPFFRRRYQSALSAAHVRYAASKPASDAIASWGHTSSELQAGVDMHRSAAAVQSSEETRMDLEDTLPGCKKIGFYAGRITEEKGIIQAAEIISALPDVGLVIAGIGPSFERLAELAAKHSNIVLLGQIENPAKYAAAADFGILLTSDSGEGRPLFALECASVGVPLIANARSEAISSLILELGTLAIVPVRPENPKEIVDAVYGVKKFRPLDLNWKRATDSLTGSLRS